MQTLDGGLHPGTKLFKSVLPLFCWHAIFINKPAYLFLSCALEISLLRENAIQKLAILGQTLIYN